MEGSYGPKEKEENNMKLGMNNKSFRTFLYMYYYLSTSRKMLSYKKRKYFYFLLSSLFID